MKETLALTPRIIAVILTGLYHFECLIYGFVPATFNKNRYSKN
jgi:hypothetical protein